MIFFGADVDSILQQIQQAPQIVTNTVQEVRQAVAGQAPASQKSCQDYLAWAASCVTGSCQPWQGGNPCVDTLQKSLGPEAQQLYAQASTGYGPLLLGSAVGALVAGNRGAVAGAILAYLFLYKK